MLVQVVANAMSDGSGLRPAGSTDEPASAGNVAPIRPRDRVRGAGIAGVDDRKAALDAVEAPQVIREAEDRVDPALKRVRERRDEPVDRAHVEALRVEVAAHERGVRGELVRLDVEVALQHDPVRVEQLGLVIGEVALAAPCAEVGIARLGRALPHDVADAVQTPPVEALHEPGSVRSLHRVSPSSSAGW